MRPPHEYKTGQFCYLKMAQGLCGAPHTFAQLKGYVGGHIPSPNAEQLSLVLPSQILGHRPTSPSFMAIRDPTRLRSAFAQTLFPLD